MCFLLEAVVSLFSLHEILRLAFQNSFKALCAPNAYFLTFLFAQQHNSFSTCLCHTKAEDFPACSDIFFVSSKSAPSTASLVSLISSRSARISWAAAPRRSISLRLLSAFSLTISTILSIGSCKRSKRFFVDRVEICLPLAICGTSTSSQEGFSFPILPAFFVLQTHSTCLVGGSRSCGLGAPGCSSHGLSLAARMVGPTFVKQRRGEKSTSPPSSPTISALNMGRFWNPKSAIFHCIALSQVPSSATIFAVGLTSTPCTLSVLLWPLHARYITPCVRSPSNMHRSRC